MLYLLDSHILETFYIVVSLVASEDLHIFGGLLESLALTLQNAEYVSNDAGLGTGEFLGRHRGQAL